MDLSDKLAKQMCFQPESFIGVYSIEYDKTNFSFQLVFEKVTEEQSALRYFDASVDTPTLITLSGRKRSQSCGLERTNVESGLAKSV